MLSRNCRNVNLLTVRYSVSVRSIAASMLKKIVQFDGTNSCLRFTQTLISRLILMRRKKVSASDTTSARAIVEPRRATEP